LGTTFGGTSGYQHDLPDLQDKFPIGASGEYSLGKSSGNTLMTIDQLPFHYHLLHKYQATNMSQSGSNGQYFDDGHGDAFTDPEIYKPCPSSNCSYNDPNGGGLEQVAQQTEHYPPYISKNYIIFTGVYSDNSSNFSLPKNSIINYIYDNLTESVEMYTDSQQKFIKGKGTKADTGGDDYIKADELVKHKHSYTKNSVADTREDVSVAVNDPTKTPRPTYIDIYDKSKTKVSEQKQFLPPYFKIYQYISTGNINLPIGSIIMYAGEQTQVNKDYFLICDGRSVDKNTYSSLYAILNNKYGESTNTFNVPDLQGVFIYGRSNVSNSPSSNELGGDDTLTAAHLPKHSHMMYTAKRQNGKNHKHNNWGGTDDKRLTSDYIQGNQEDTEFTSNTTRSKFLPPYLALNYVIYAGPPNNSVEQYTPNNMKLNSFVL